MAAATRALRNASIVAERTRGDSWASICARHDVGERQARRIVQEHTVPGEGAAAAQELLDEMVEAFEAGIEDLALIAMRSNSDSVRLGAIKAKLKLMEKRAGLLGAPSLYRRAGDEVDAWRTGEAVVAILEKHDASYEFRRDLVEAMRNEQPPPEVRQR